MKSVAEKTITRNLHLKFISHTTLRSLFQKARITFFLGIIFLSASVKSQAQTWSQDIGLMKVGTTFSGSVSVSGLSGAVTYSVSSGALPAGLTLSSGGTISGSPTVAGKYAFTVQATDGIQTVTRSFKREVYLPGLIFTWGRNVSGVLGVGKTLAQLPNSPTPQPVDPTKKWVAMTSGEFTILALDDAGKLYAWGDNALGNFGNNTKVSSTVPVLIDDGTVRRWVSIGAGAYFSYGLTADDELYIWGANYSGMLGNGTTTEQLVPLKVTIPGERWVSVSSGYEHVIAVTESGKLYGWGSGYYGQNGGGQTCQPNAGINCPDLLGGGKRYDIKVPTQIGSDTDWYEVYAGGFASFAVKQNGKLYSWGDNSTAQLGLGSASTTPGVIPAQIGTDTDWNLNGTNIVMPGPHALGLKGDGKLFGWGEMANGKLFNDLTTGNQTTPVQVLSNKIWRKVSASSNNSFAIDANYDMVAVGSNGNGAVGDGTLTSTTTSVSSGTLGKWFDFSSSDLYQFSAALGVYKIVVAPVTSTIVVGSGTQVLTATAAEIYNDKPITWSISNPSLASFTVDPNNDRVITVTPLAGGTVTLTATVEGTSATATITINVLPAWTDEVLVTCMTKGQAYTDQITASGFPTPTYAVSAGNLPAGLSLNTATGEITGTATTAGTYTFTIKALNAAGEITKQFTLSVTDWTASSIGLMKVGQSFTGSVTASGTGLTYSVSSGSLPVGLTLNSTTGAITGTPTVAGDYSFTLEASCGSSSIFRKFRRTVYTAYGNELYTWGNAGSGVLGDGTFVARSAPGKVGTPAEAWVMTANSVQHALAITETGKLYAWGDNLEYQLGNGTTTSSSTPIQVCVGNCSSAQPLWIKVDAGNLMSAGLTAEGKLYAWGRCVNGSTGNFAFTTGNVTVPTLVNPPAGDQWMDMAVGFNYMIAITASGKLYTWGSNFSNQLGDGTTNTVLFPARIATGLNKTWEQIAAGYDFGLAITTDGELYSWGKNSYGQLGIGNNTQQSTPQQVGTDTDWKLVTAGLGHTIAIKTNGALYGWGLNASGQLGNGTTTSRNTPVAIATNVSNTWMSLFSGRGANSFHTLALATNGHLYAFGSNTVGQIGDGTTTNRSTAVRVKSSYRWIRTALDGTSSSAIGLEIITLDKYALNMAEGDPSEKITGTVSTTLTDKTILWTSSNPAIASVDANGNVTPLARGTATITATTAEGGYYITASVVVGSRVKWTDETIVGCLQKGVAYSDAVVADGDPAATYSLSAGALPAGLTFNTTTATISGTPTVSGTFTFTISATNLFNTISKEFTVNILEWTTIDFGLLKKGKAFTGSIASAGAGVSYSVSSGSLPAGLTLNSTTGAITGTPTEGGSYAFTLAASCGASTIYRKFQRTVYTDYGSELYTWGNAGSGVLGDGTFVARSAPVKVGTPAEPWVMTANSVQHALAITETGKLYAWGNNDFYQLGDGTNTATSTPIQICIGGCSTTQPLWVKVDAGNFMSAGLTVEGKIYTWGLNNSGSTGNLPYSSANVTVPTVVNPPAGDQWMDMAVGFNYMIAITASGKLYTWGANFANQLGDGTTTERLYPTQIAAGLNKTWERIAAGYDFGLAITTAGELYSWGKNSYGQLGLGNNTQQSTPQQVGTDTDWKLVTAGLGHTIAIKTNGGLYGWGFNASGQLGNGTTTSRNTPVAIATNVSNTWMSLFSGRGANSFHTLALATNGHLYAFGSNTVGQIGDGTTTNRSTAVRVKSSYRWIRTALDGSSSSAIGLEIITLDKYALNMAEGDPSEKITGTVSTTLTDKTILWTSSNPAIASVDADGNVTPLARGTATITATTAEGGYYITASVVVGARVKWTDETIVGCLQKGVAYSDAVVADGDPAATYSLSAGALPAGLAFNATTATISGTPTVSGTFTFTISATNSFNTISKEFTVNILEWTTIDFGLLKTGQAFTGSIASAGAGVSYSVSSGSLPAGLTLNGATGAITGTPTEGGSYAFTLAASCGASTIYRKFQRTVYTDYGNELYTWGNAGFGLLGDGTSITRSTPVKVALPAEAWVMTANAEKHVLAITENGKLYAWGDNQFFQLGDGTNTATTTPIQICIGGCSTTQPLWVKVDASNSMSAGLTVEGKLYTWGRNVAGSTGNLPFSSADVTAPTLVNPPAGDQWMDMAVGSNFMVAVTVSGKLYTWGSNFVNQLGDGTTTDRLYPAQIAAGLNKTWERITAGYDFAMAITTAGELYSWGNNGYGQLGLGNSTRQSTPQRVGTDNDWKLVSAAFGHTIAIKNNGALYGWGFNVSGQLGNGTTTSRNTPAAIATNVSNTWMSLFAGRGANTYHTLALATNGHLYAFGSNSFGQLGDGTNTNRSTAVRIKPSYRWQRTAIDGNASSALGLEIITLDKYSLNLVAGTGAVKITETVSQTLADRSVTWTSTDPTVAGVDATGNVTPLSKGTVTIRATTNQGGYYIEATVLVGELPVWTDETLSDCFQPGVTYSDGMQANGFPQPTYSISAGQLPAGLNLNLTTGQFTGIPTGSGNYDFTVKAENILGFIEKRFTGVLFATNALDVGLMRVGTPFTGNVTTASNQPVSYQVTYGSLPDGLQLNASTGIITGTPTKAGRFTFTITITGQSGCGLVLQFNRVVFTGFGVGLFAMGTNDDGRLGDGTTTQQSCPTEVKQPVKDWAMVVAGGSHSLAITSEGELYAWGKNSNGQLGDPALALGAVVKSPTKVCLGNCTAAQPKWTYIAATRLGSFAITAEGKLYAWGGNEYGQLGLNLTTTSNVNTPTQITSPAFETWTIVAGGSDHVSALSQSGKIYSWGRNHVNQLGDGSGTDRLVPVQTGVSLSKSWIRIAAGANAGMAITTDGDLYSWGSAANGQLGNNTTSGNLSTPARIGQGIIWREIAAGSGHALALDKDNKLYGWGLNTNGQVGDNSTTSRSVPVLVNQALQWESLALGSYASEHSAAITSLGYLYTWGANSGGQLGDCLLTRRLAPFRVGESVRWVQTTTNNNNTISTALAMIVLDKLEVRAIEGGNSQKITAFVSTLLNDKSVTWVSSDPRIATVSDDGTVTPVTPGTVIITATTVEGGYFTTATVYVNSKPEILVKQAPNKCGYLDLDVTATNITMNLAGQNKNYQYIEVPNKLQEVADFTFEAWVYLTANNYWQRIIDFGKDANVYFFFTANAGDTNRPRYAISLGGNPAEQRLDANVGIPLNTWTHLAISVNGSNNTGKMYMNGVEVGSNSNMTLNPTKLGITTKNYFGKSQYPDPYFQGKMDEVRMWSVARTADEIKRSFSVQFPSNYPGLVAYYKMDEGAGTQTFDSSPNKAVGILKSFNSTIPAGWEVPGTSPSGNFKSYLWSNGGINTFTRVTASGNYSLTVTDKFDQVTVVPITVTVNSCPIPADDTQQAIQAVPYTSNVLTNDIDAENSLSVSKITVGGVDYLPVGGVITANLPSGKLVVNPNGSYTFTSNPSFFGSVPQVTVTVLDGGGSIVTSKLNINVKFAPVVATATEDVTLKGTVLVNGTGPVNTISQSITQFKIGTTTYNAGSTAAISNVGSLLIRADGTYDFIPALNYNGTVPQVTFTAKSSLGNTDTGLFDLTVVPVNDVPVAFNNAKTTNEEVSASGDVIKDPDGSNNKDSDVDGDALSVASFRIGATDYTPGSTATIADIGSFTLSAGGAWSFVPVLNYYGAVPEIRYTITDGVLTASAVLSITVRPVNDPPVAGDDTEDTPDGIPVSGLLLANDNDPENDALHVSGVSTDGVNFFPTGTELSVPEGKIIINSNGSYTFMPAPGYLSGPVSPFYYKVSDTGNLTDIGKLEIVVAFENDAPVAEDNTKTTNEEVQVSGNVITDAGPTGKLDSDQDTPVNQLVVTEFTVRGQTYSSGTTVQLAGVGTITVQSNGSWTFTPALNFNGTADVVTYRLADNRLDGTDGTDLATLTITVNPVNDNPVAFPDVVETNEETAVTGNVIDNDADVDGDQLSVTGFTFGGVNYQAGQTNTLTGFGSLIINSTGAFTFIPSTDFFGPVPEITYTISDGAGGSASGKLTINVLPVNDAPAAADDTGTIAEDNILEGNVITNDVSPDKDVMYINEYKINGISYGAGTTATIDGVGIVVIRPDGSYTFTPALDFNGTVPAITYTVSDDAFLSSTAQLLITVTPVNDAPVAGNDTEDTPDDTPVSGDLFPNDYDVDGDAFTVTGVSTDQINFTAPGTAVNTPEGSIVIQSDGTYTFTPDPFISEAKVSPVYYKITDPGNLSGVGRLDLFIVFENDPPVAEDDAATTDEDTEAFGNLLDGQNSANVADSDPDTPFSDLVVLDFTVDGTTYIAGATAVIRGKGTLTVSSDGTWTFVPYTDYNGVFPQVEYSLGDSQLDGNDGIDKGLFTITVTPVPDAPVAVNDFFNTREEVLVSGFVLPNDRDADGNSLTVTGFKFGSTTYPAGQVANIPGIGFIIIDSDGSFAYQPFANYNGNVPVFTYTIDDGTSRTAIGEIHIYVDPVNDAPQASDEEFQILQGALITGNLLDNDSDIDGDQLQIIKVRIDGVPVQVGVVTTLPGIGSFQINSDGIFVYVSDLNFFGSAPLVIYSVQDEGGESAVDGILSITVNGLPQPTGDHASDVVDQVLNGNLLLNDTDPDGHLLAVTKINYAGTEYDLSGGPVTVTAQGKWMVVISSDGTITATPEAGFTGAIDLDYTVCDNSTPVACSSSAVNLNWVEFRLYPDANTSQLSQKVTGLIVLNDVLPGKPVITAESADTGNPAGALFTIDQDGNYEFTATLSGTYKFLNKVCITSESGVPACKSELLTIVVSDPSKSTNPPVAGSDVAVAKSNGSVNIKVLANDFPGNRENKIVNSTLTIKSQPSSGSVSINSDGTVTYTPQPGFTGEDVFYYEVCDDQTPAVCSQALVHINVINANALNGTLAADDFAVTTGPIPVTGNLLTNDMDAEGNTQTVKPQNLTIPEGTVSISSNGAYTFTGKPTLNATVSIPYTVCDNGTPSACASATLNVLVRLASIDAVDDDLSAKTVNGFTGGSVASVFTNDLLNGEVLVNALASVTLISNGGITGATINAGNGNIVVPAGTAAGTYTVSYKICQVAVPEICDQAQAIIVVIPPVLVADDDNYTASPISNEDGGTVGSIFDNDKINGNTISTDLRSLVSASITDDGGVTGLTIDEDGQITIPPDFEPGVYTITVQICEKLNPANCDTAIVTIKIEYTQFKPSGAVTPNGDGKNDTFYIRGLSAFPDHSLVIVNRWGNVIYKAAPYKNDWDGKSSNALTFSNSERVPAGTYFYVIDLGNGRKESGSFYLAY